MIRATAKPAGNHQVRNTERGPTASRLTPNANTSSGTSHLLVIASPTAAPIANHHRPSPVRSNRIVKKPTTVHSAMSTVAVDSMCVTASTNTDSAVAAAASTCAPRPPPSSRAVSATNATIAAPISVAEIRNVNGESPNENSRASSGVNGGWSTYPQSRRRPAARKYSSSRWNPYRPANTVSTATWMATTIPTSRTAKDAIVRA